MRSLICLIVLVPCYAATGCGRPDQSSAKSQAAGTSVRAARRAYPGAPPVIPHPPLSGACTTCHSGTGMRVPQIGFAPPNPHTRTPGLSAHSRCRQCHAFARTDGLFQENLFAASTELRRGSRAHPYAPPTIPHSHFLREDCLTCHAGPAARPEFRCSHPDRVRCAQCHVRSDRFVSGDNAFD